MAGKRVVFFGVTGVEKTGGETVEEWGVLKRLAIWADLYKERRPRPQVVDFEGQYLFRPENGGKEWFSFLDDQQQTQREIWRCTWPRFVEEVLPGTEQDIFVSMHGCIVRGHYGVRTIIDPRDVAEWVKPSDPKVRARPDLIVTLLDDVYDMWWRTERRAHGEDYRGRPTLEQLIFARRTELIVADQVAYSVDPPIPHFMISVAHPCETLGNRIYSPNPRVVYLCFPISAPRDLRRDEDDASGEAEIMSFLATANERQHRNPNLVFVCPLGIDELPLVEVTKGAIRRLNAEDDLNTAAPVQFDRDSLRWPMDSLWEPDSCLSPGPPPPGDCDPIPLAQLDAAAGMMHTDVGWRDYRLVEQARGGCLAVFNPIFKNRYGVSRSVREEIDFATGICPVYFYQNREHDPGHVAEREYPQRGGTMPLGPRTQMVIRKNTVNELFDAVEGLTRRRSR